MLIYSKLPVSPERIFILGAGKFGSSAAIGVSRQWPGCEIHLVDSMKHIPLDLPGEHYSATDAIEFLRKNLDKHRPDDLIIPCIPHHVAFNWVLGYFGCCVPVPARLMEILPGAIPGKDGCIYTSLSDFICPANCSEPEGMCSTTGQKRDRPLYSVIESVDLDFYHNITVRSGQLLPGVGAFTAEQMFALLAAVGKMKGRFLVATASRCHGVIHGLAHRKKVSVPNESICNSNRRIRKLF